MVSSYSYTLWVVCEKVIALRHQKKSCGVIHYQILTLYVIGAMTQWKTVWYPHYSSKRCSFMSHLKIALWRYEGPLGPPSLKD